MSVDSGSEDGEYEDSDQSDDDRGMSVSSDNRSRHASEENKQQPAMLPKIMEWAQIFALLLASYLSIDLIGTSLAHLVHQSTRHVRTSCSVVNVADKPFESFFLQHESWDSRFLPSRFCYSGLHLASGTDLRINL